MNELWASFSTLDKVFALCALIGGLLFIIRVALQLFGLGDHNHDLSQFDGHQEEITDADASFKLLSLQGLTGFFMMFGLVGLSLSQQSGTTWYIALAGGLIAGALSTWLIQSIFQGANKLQSSGNFNIQNAIGVEGDVYLTVPANNTGVGKVQIKAQSRLMILDARSQNTENLITGTRIRVASVTDDGLLLVEKA